MSTVALTKNGDSESESSKADNAELDEPEADTPADAAKPKKVRKPAAAKDKTAAVPSERLAGWLPRAGALALDYLFGIALIATMAVLQAASPLYGVLWWVYVTLAVVMLAAMLVNRLVLPVKSGWTLGRAVFGLQVVRNGEPVDAVRLALRELAHLVDTVALGIGWLWPLWDTRKRTFADLLAGTEVQRAQGSSPPRFPARKAAACAVVAVAAVCAAGVGVNYLLVYRHESAVETARAQIDEQGPQLVEQILGYGLETRGADFAHAQTLVTDEYRPRLVEDQLTAAAMPPVNNEYWTVNSAVLNASPDAASMLLMMQGRRATTNEDAQFITATVRASFEKDADGAWKVSNLEVLTKPRPVVEATPE